MTTTNDESLEFEDKYATLKVEANVDSNLSVMIHEFSERAWFELSIEQCSKLRDFLNKHIENRGKEK